MLIHSKTELRRKFRKVGEDRLKSSPSLNDELLQTILHSTLSLSEQNLGLYFPRGFELDLLSLWEKFKNRTYFPLTQPHNLELHYHRVSTLDDLSFGYGNIKEPKPLDSTRLKAWDSGDFIFIPGLSFDSEGYRLGSGKGIFDRYLANLPDSVTTVGVCLEEQLSPTPLPRENHDIPLKMIATPKRLIKVV